MKNLSFPGLPRVLIVDDEEGVREGLRSMLQREGLHVETAGTAEEGARRVESRSFDIVFLDLNLPGADGLSILGQLRTGQHYSDESRSEYIVAISVGRDALFSENMPSI